VFTNTGIWLLGNEVTGVQKCLQWYASDIPNFADCNTLIVDMTTLDPQTLHGIEYKKCKELFNGILSRYKAGGEIICIINESFSAKTYEDYVIDNYFWCPIRLQINKVKPAKSWQPSEPFQFADYMNAVKEWNLVLEQEKTLPKHDWNSYESYASINIQYLVLSNSNEIIAGTFSSAMPGFAGIIHLLPPTSNSKEDIKRILKNFGVTEKISTSTPPNWIESISIPKLTEVKKLISTENKKIKETQKTILSLENQQNDLEKFRFLLYSDGPQLEDIVMKSLQKIRLSGIRKGRDDNHEDLIFDFESTEHDVCVIEVKGMAGNMKLAYLRQALNWALDYQVQDKKAKPLLIANIYRLEDLKTSRSKRESFVDFKEFYKQYDICILPTTTLFDLVCMVLEGKKISLKKFEELVLSTKGVLRDLTSVIGSD